MYDAPTMSYTNSWQDVICTSDAVGEWKWEDGAL